MNKIIKICCFAKRQPINIHVPSLNKFDRQVINKEITTLFLVQSLFLIICDTFIGYSTLNSLLHVL